MPIRFSVATLSLLVFSASLAAAKTYRVVTVQPIVVCDSDGNRPAPCYPVEPLLDQVFASAGIDIHLVEPITFHNTQAREGKLPPEDIVAAAIRDNVPRLPTHQINLFFVSQIDGNDQPAAWTPAPGWTGLLRLPQQPDPHRDALAVAQAVGRCLGLVNASEDKRIRDTSGPNLMGSGTAKERLRKSGLLPHQIDVIQQSPLVRPHVECLTLDDGRRNILDETFEPYFSQLQRREIGAITTVAANAESLDECREIARRQFANMVLPFDDREVETMGWYVEQIEQKLRQDFPLFTRQPWRFIKTRNALCGGFPHTRGYCVFFCERILNRMVELRHADNDQAALDTFGSLFVHEQMHVLQRCFPERFAGLSTEVFRWVRAEVEDHPWFVERQIQNPDALRLEWLIPDDRLRAARRWYWPRTYLRGTDPVPRMGADFVPVAVQVVAGEDGTYRPQINEEGIPAMVPLDGLAWYFAGIGPGRGLDHPNEIAAYAFGSMFTRLYGSEPPRDAADDEGESGKMQQFRTWCRENLK